MAFLLFSPKIIKKYTHKKKTKKDWDVKQNWLQPLVTCYVQWESSIYLSFICFEWIFSSCSSFFLYYYLMCMRLPLLLYMYVCMYVCIYACTELTSGIQPHILLTLLMLPLLSKYRRFPSLLYSSSYSHYCFSSSSVVNLKSFAYILKSLYYFHGNIILFLNFHNDMILYNLYIVYLILNNSQYECDYIKVLFINVNLFLSICLLFCGLYTYTYTYIHSKKWYLL